MLALDDFVAFRRTIEQLTRDVEHSRGVLSEKKKQLRKDLKIKTFKGANRRILKSTERQQELLREHNKEVKAFKKKWRKVLKEIEG